MFTHGRHSVPKVFIIHENGEWTKPLITALESRNIPYSDWDMSTGILDLSQPAPEGVFYNRMSASSHTRGNRFAPEMSVGVLAWLESQDRITFNGRSALNLEISKLVQYTALEKVQLLVPQTIAVSSREDVIRAYRSLPFDEVITKHNRAGKGLGVQLLKSEAAANEHIHNPGFEDSVDGLSLVQQYIRPADGTITRVEFIGREFLYAVKVDTSNGFELCPADECQINSNCPTSDIPKFKILEDFSMPNIDAYESFLAANDIGISGIEFILDEQGQAWTYDVNVNTNYNSKAEAEGVKFAYKEVIRYLASLQENSCTESA